MCMALRLSCLVDGDNFHIFKKMWITSKFKIIYTQCYPSFK
jgi:hypothetical protein